MDYWKIESLGLKVGDWIEWGATPREVIQEDGTIEVALPPHTRGQVVAIREGSTLFRHSGYSSHGLGTGQV